MRSTDQTEFVRVLVGMAAMKPGAKLTEESIELWWRKMRNDWTIEDFKTAADFLIGEVEFMPSPFHFERLRRAGQATADEAWLLVISGAPLAPGSRAQRAAMMVGGQYAIRHADTVNALPHIQRRFLKAYDELSDVDESRKALPQFTADDVRALLPDLSSPKLLR